MIIAGRLPGRPIDTLVGLCKEGNADRPDLQVLARDAQAELTWILEQRREAIALLREIANDNQTAVSINVAVKIVSFLERIDRP